MFKNRNIITMLLIAIFLLSIPVIADASIKSLLGGAKDFVFDNMITSIMAILFGVIGTFFAATKWGSVVMKSRVAVEGLFDVLKLIRKAKAADSPGGTKITDDEKKKIWDKLESIVVDTIKAVTGKKIV